MFWNNDDDFDEAANHDEVNEEALNEIRKEHQRIYNMPVMIKARQIYELVISLIETFKEEDDLTLHYKELMMCDAGILGAKIAAAENGDFYMLRIENAVQVKLAAKGLLVQSSGLKMLGLSEPHYLQLLVDEIEEFRNLFVEWVASFDRSKDLRDDWGLFY